MISISGIEPHMVDIVWPNVKRQIAMACDKSNGELSPETIFRDLIEDKMRLIVMRDDENIIAVMTIKIDNFDTGKKVLTICTVGGTDIDKWVDEIDKALVEISKREGCSEMYIVGRSGWVRKLKKLGYEPIHTTVCKKVA